MEWEGQLEPARIEAISQCDEAANRLVKKKRPGPIVSGRGGSPEFLEEYATLQLQDARLCRHPTAFIAELRKYYSIRLLNCRWRITQLPLN
jgi:hypothetical protein